MSIESNQQDSQYEAHDEGYFASFTDLLIGILFIFIIMLMMFASNFQEQQLNAGESTKKLEALTKALTEITDTRNKVLVEMQKSLERQGVEVTINLKNGILRLPDSLLFESGEWEPSERGRLALIKLSNTLNKYLPCLSNASDKLKSQCGKLNELSLPILETVLVEGHTDKIPFIGGGKFNDNWWLSAKRSITVYKMIVEYAPNLNTQIMNRNNEPILGVSGYADSRPVSQDDLQKNRRIDLRFIVISPTPKEIEAIQNKIERR